VGLFSTISPRSALRITGMTTIHQRPYLSYLLRLWQVYQDGQQIWRASLESAQTGALLYFANLAELTAYLAQQVRTAEHQHEEEVIHRLLQDWSDCSIGQQELQSCTADQIPAVCNSCTMSTFESSSHCLRRKSMLVERRTHYIKAGRGEEAMELLLAHDWGVPVRLYQAMTGRMDVLVGEAEWESVEASNQYWERWSAQPAAQTFLEQWRQFVEPVWTREFFEAHTLEASAGPTKR
jgi:hypothetical protein